jgi:hypothetical protein
LLRVNDVRVGARSLHNQKLLDAACGTRNHAAMNEESRVAAIFVRFSLQRLAIALVATAAVLAVIVACFGIAAAIAAFCLGAGACSLASRP